MGKISMLILVILGAVGILLFGDIASEGAINALGVSANSLIPGIFPFMAIGYMFVKTGGGVIFGKLFGKFFERTFKVSGGCTLPFVVGLVSGYPTAAGVTVSSVKNGEISKEDAENILGWCTNPGIVFVLANSKSIGEGLMVWCSVVIAGIIAGIITGRNRTIKMIPYAAKTEKVSCARCFVDSVKDATSNMIVICGFVVFFGTFLSVIDVLPLWNKTGDSNILKSIVFGLIEIVSGCRKLLTIAMPVTLRVPLMSMLFAWSGICVHMQIIAISEECKLNIKKYLITKLLTCVVAPAVSFIMLKIMPKTILVSYITPTHNIVKIFTVSFITALILWVILLWVISVFSPNRISAEK